MSAHTNIHVHMQSSQLHTEWHRWSALKCWRKIWNSLFGQQVATARQCVCVCANVCVYVCRCFCSACCGVQARMYWHPKPHVTSTSLSLASKLKFHINAIVCQWVLRTDRLAVVVNVNKCQNAKVLCSCGLTWCACLQFFNYFLVIKKFF